MSAPGMRWETVREQTARLGRVGMWAPGSYICKCSACERQFEGDKRATNCLPCAVAYLDMIASRLAAAGLAVVIEEAAEAWDWHHMMSPTSAIPISRCDHIANALIDHITAPEEKTQ